MQITTSPIPVARLTAVSKALEAADVDPCGVSLVVTDGPELEVELPDGTDPGVLGARGVELESTLAQAAGVPVRLWIEA